MKHPRGLAAAVVVLLGAAGATGCTSRATGHTTTSPAAAHRPAAPAAVRPVPPTSGPPRVVARAAAVPPARVVARPAATPPAKVVARPARTAPARPARTVPAPRTWTCLRPPMRTCCRARTRACMNCVRQSFAERKAWFRTCLPFLKRVQCFPQPPKLYCCPGRSAPCARCQGWQRRLRRAWELKCKLRVPRSYRACGCGCCGGRRGASGPTSCLYFHRGDDIRTIIAGDRNASSNPRCRSMGCSHGTLYKYCD